jgi:hypothetical protein
MRCIGWNSFGFGFGRVYEDDWISTNSFWIVIWRFRISFDYLLGE